MIKSSRKFGIEIEFVCQTESSLRNIRNRINVVRDGSLDPLPYAGEYVSQPLQGNDGASVVHSACEVLKKYGAKADNPKTSVHVHLDGRAGGNNLRSSSTQPTDVDPRRVICISNKLRGEMTPRQILGLTMGGFVNMDFIIYTRTVFDDIRYYSKAELSKKPRIGYTYYWIESNDRFNWLRNVFYFYTMFSDVMGMIVSDSRKQRNMYCIPLGSSYNLNDIAATENMEQLRNLWYKGRPSAGHYDDSRYHNVNLHCFWDRHGTVEIRSHGGTIDPHKILLWVRLHQKIVDKLEDMTIEELVKMGNTPRDFTEFVEEPLLQDYVKRLAGYYSGVRL